MASKNSTRHGNASSSFKPLDTAQLALARAVRPVFEGLERRQLLNGALDTTFGTAGKAVTDFGAQDIGDGMAVFADGSFVVVGESAGLFALAKYNADGSLDTNFGTGGTVTTTIGSNASATSVAIDGNGRIVVGGYALIGSTEDFALARYDGATGALDNSFGTAGVVTTDFANRRDNLFALTILPSGQIVGIGTVRTGAAGVNDDFGVAVYDPATGALDASFDGDGKATTDFGGVEDARGVAFDAATGRIVVAGESDGKFALAAFNASTGALDITFDTDGRVTTTFPGSAIAMAVAVDSGGNYVAAGTSGGDIAAARYTTTGALDNSFDTDGLLTIDFAGGFDQANAIALQGDGKILLAGVASQGSSGDFALARLTTAGALDTTFGLGTGKVTTDIAGNSDSAAAVALQPTTGKVLVSGTGNGGASQDNFATVRYDSVQTEAWVNDNWVITDDVGPVGLSFGDTVENSGTGDTGALVTKVFGFDAFDSIEDALASVAGGPSSTVHVEAGTYLESDISVTKEVTIDGYAALPSQVVVAPAVADGHLTGGGQVFNPLSHNAFVIRSSGVGIIDLTIDGDAGVGGAGSKNYFGGIVYDYNLGQAFNNLRAENLTLQNIWRVGIYFDGGINALSTGHNVADNTIDNVAGGTGPTGILMLQASGNVTGNTISNVAGDGIGTNYIDGAAFAPAIIIQGNTISGTDTGMNLSGLASGSAVGGAVAGEANVITLAGGGADTGIVVQYAVGTVTVSNNTISGDGDDSGIWLYHNASSAAPLVTGNTITSTSSTSTNPGDGTGIFVTDDGSFFTENSGGDSYATITGNTISGFVRGIDLYRNEDNPAGGFTVNVTIDGNNDISGNGTGIRVFDANGTTAANAVATITGNSASISGNTIGIDVAGGTATITNNHIFDNGTGVQVRDGGVATIDDNDFDGGADDNGTDVLVSSTAPIGIAGGAMSGNSFGADNFFVDNESTQNIDVLASAGNTFSGLNLFRVEDRMHHRADSDRASAGKVSVVTGQWFVTDPAIGVGSTDSSIQFAIDAANSGDTVNIEGGTYTEHVTINKAITLDGEGSDPTPLVNWTGNTGSPLITVTSTNATDDITVLDIAFDGGGTVGDGIRAFAPAANFDALTLDRSTFNAFTTDAIDISGDAVNGIAPRNIVITNSSFTNNGSSGSGGTGDISIFQYNGDATLSNLTLVGSAVGNTGARIGIQFRGVGDAAGNGFLPMGNVSLSDIDISGAYRTSFLGIQRYNDVTGLSMNNVELGGATSEVSGTFGALLRFDAVGVGTVASPASIDLGNTFFRGLAPASAQQAFLEFAPDNNFTFLRADATDTRWNLTSGSNIVASSMTLAQAFEATDRMLDYVKPNHPVHGAFKGWAELQDGKAFNTPLSDNISRGIEMVDANGTVHVQEGNYSHDVVVSKTVTLLGAQSGVDPRPGRAGPETVLVGTGANAPIRINSGVNDVVIDGFTIQSPAGGSGALNGGIYAVTTTNLDVRNNIIENNTAGVAIGAGTSGIVTRNVIRNNNAPGSGSGNGVEFFAPNSGTWNVTENLFGGNDNADVLIAGGGTVANVTISSNEFTNSTGNAVAVFQSDNISVTGNTVTNAVFSGMVFGGGVTNSSMSGNTFTDNQSRAILVADLGFGTGGNSSISITDNVINQDVADLTASRSMIEFSGTAGTNLIDGNTVTLSGTMGGAVTFVHGITVANLTAGSLTVSDNEVHGNGVDTVAADRSVGIRLSGVTSGASLVGNDVDGFNVGVRVNPSTALLQGNDLNGNTIGVLIESGSIVDLGQNAPGTDFTGLGISTGGNDFSGYTTTATASAGAIVNAKTDAPNDDPGRQGLPNDVPAFGNLWAVNTPTGIENVIYHDVDDSGVGFVEYAVFGNLLVSLTSANVPEGSTTTVNGSFTNVAAAHTVTINWGDGSPDTVVNLAAGDQSFSIASPAGTTYGDDPDGAVNTINYPITVTIAELPSNDSIADTSLSVDVTNVAPTIAVSGSLTVNEGSVYTLNLGAITDPGDDTVFRYIINWGDGSFTDITADPSNTMHTHTYDDGTLPRNITISLFDEDAAPHGNAGDPSPLAITVENVAPTANFFNGGPVPEGSNGLVGFGAQFDPSTADTTAGFLYSYDFNNDGDFTDAGELSDVTNASVGVPAQYLNDGPGVRTVRGRIKDKDGGFTDYTTNITIVNITPFVNAGPDINVPANTLFTQNGTFADPGADAPWTATVDYDIGDANPAVPLTLSGFNFTLSHTYTAPGTYTIRVTVTDKDGATGQDDVIVNVGPTPTFQVNQFLFNTSGFTLRFNRAADTSGLNLYDGLDGVTPSAEPADLTLVGNSVGAVRGSLVWDPATNTATFVRTGGALEPDTYTLTVRSDSNAFKDTLGNLLDGDANGTAGDDFVTNFNVTSLGQRTISIPDFARGPDSGSNLNVPNTGTLGLPVRIDDGSQVRSVDFTLRYDPNLLEITGAQLAAGLPGDWAITSNLTTPGTAVITVFGTSTDLPAGPQNLVKLIASVPDNAAYTAAGVLRFTNIIVSRNDASTISSRGDSGIHKVVYFGDADADRAYTGFDAGLISRVVVGLDSGFHQMPLTDPVIGADIDGSGGLSGIDASFVAQKAALLPRPEIPDLPAVLPPAVPGGIDPLFSSPDNKPGRPGGTVLMPIDIDDASNTLGFNLTIDYDTALLDLANADVQLGSLYTAAGGWSLVTNVDDATGHATLVFWRSSGVPMPPGSGGGEVATANFTVAPGAAHNANAPVELDGNPGGGSGLVFTFDDGSVLVDAVAPTVLTDNYKYQTAPHTLDFEFSEDVAASLTAADFVVFNNTTSTTIPATDFTLSYNATTNVATLTYTPTNGVLPDGNYTVTITAADVTDEAGNPLPANHQFDFFFLMADANHDGRVNLEDFNILASNFGQSNRDFTQADFDYNGLVNLNDFNILAARFGVVLGPDGTLRPPSGNPPPVPGAPVVGDQQDEEDEQQLDPAADRDGASAATGTSPSTSTTSSATSTDTDVTSSFGSIGGSLAIPTSTSSSTTTSTSPRTSGSRTTAPAAAWSPFSSVRVGSTQTSLASDDDALSATADYDASLFADARIARGTLRTL